MDGLACGQYHALDVGDKTRGADVLLERYRRERGGVLAGLREAPEALAAALWKKEGPLAYDGSCACALGERAARTPYACAQCRSLGRLADYRAGGASGRPFLLQCGAAAGKRLVLASESAVPFLASDPAAPLRARAYVQRHPAAACCGTAVPPRCLAGDPFTVKTLLAWALEEHFSARALPHAASVHTAFVCRGRACSLLDALESFGDLAAGGFTPASAAALFAQLLVACRELAALSFSYGAPSAASLLFAREPVAYLYEGARVEAPFTLKVLPSDGSSALVGDTYVYARDAAAEMSIARFPFTPDFEERRVPGAASARFYRLRGDALALCARLRHVGYPLFTGSFDLYCFSVSLACDPAFSAALLESPARALWEALWLPEDLPVVSNRARLCAASGGCSFDAVFLVLRGVWLRCDAVAHLWELLVR